MVSEHDTDLCEEPKERTGRENIPEREPPLDQIGRAGIPDRCIVWGCWERKWKFRLRRKSRVKDYFTIPEAEIGSVFPLMTVLGGKTVVMRQELAKEFGVAPAGPQMKWEFKTTYDFGDALKSTHD